MVIEQPRKSVYQIYLLENAVDKIILDAKIVAYSESEAIEKAKVGSIIKELRLNRKDVDFYIKIVGHLYEGKAFAEVLSKTQVLTVAEKENVGKTIESKIDKLLKEIDELKAIVAVLEKKVK